MLLYLAGNNKLVTDVRLGDADVRLLCETLKNNTFVTSLDLRYNNITDEGAKHIAKLIEETLTLKEINLMCNDFGEDGAEAIAEALQVSMNAIPSHIVTIFCHGNSTNISIHDRHATPLHIITIFVIKNQLVPYGTFKHSC